jgi:hypothetical protein
MTAVHLLHRNKHQLYTGLIFSQGMKKRPNNSGESLHDLLHIEQDADSVYLIHFKQK